jgi:hypothetical protein
MRDPKRIETILSKIQLIWMSFPDMRLCQLISNLAQIQDIFYIEDDELERRIDVLTRRGWVGLNEYMTEKKK